MQTSAAQAPPQGAPPSIDPNAVLAFVQQLFGGGSQKPSADNPVPTTGTQRQGPPQAPIDATPQQAQNPDLDNIVGMIGQMMGSGAATNLPGAPMPGTDTGVNPNALPIGAYAAPPSPAQTGAAAVSTTSPDAVQRDPFERNQGQAPVQAGSSAAPIATGSQGPMPKATPVLVGPAGDQVDAGDKDALNAHVFHLLDQAAQLRDEAAKLSPAAIRSMSPLEAGLSLFASAFDPTHSAGNKFVDAFQQEQQARLPGAQAKVAQQQGALTTQAEGLEKQAQLENSRFGTLTEAEMAKAEQANAIHKAQIESQTKESVAGIGAQSRFDVQNLKNKGSIDVAQARALARKPLDDARAAWLKAQTDTNVATRANRVALLESQNKHQQALTEASAAQSQLAQSRKKLVDAGVSWYPKVMAAKINNEMMRAQASMKNADTAYQRFNSEVTNKGAPSATSMLNARTKAMAQRDTNLSAWQSAMAERKLLQDQFGRETNPQQKSNLQSMLDANAASLAFNHSQYEAASRRVSDIDAIVQQKGVIGTRLMGADSDRENGLILYNQYVKAGDQVHADQVAQRFMSTYGEPLIPSGMEPGIAEPAPATGEAAG